MPLGLSPSLLNVRGYDIILQKNGMTKHRYHSRLHFLFSVSAITKFKEETFNKNSLCYYFVKLSPNPALVTREHCVLTNDHYMIVLSMKDTITRFFFFRETEIVLQDCQSQYI